MSIQRFASICSIMLFSASIACAQLSGIYVEYYSVLNPHDGWAAVPGFPNRHATPTPEPGRASGSHISINNANVVPYRVFAVDYSNTDIGSITFGSSQTTTELMVGQGAIQVTAGQPLAVPGARHVGDIVGGGVIKLRVQARVEGTIHGDVCAYEVVRLDAGAITGAVDHNPGADSAAPALGLISAGSISGNIRSWRGPITMVKTTGNCTSAIQANGDIGTIQIGTTQNPGNFLGSITALSGKIALIEAVGNIGAPGNLASISTTHTSGVEPYSDISSIKAASIYANITTPNVGNSNRGDVTRIETTVGSFVGSLTAYAVQHTGPGIPAMVIKTDLDADIDVLTIKRPIKITGAFKASRTIRIREDLKSVADIEITADQGLEGQIIINADNGTPTSAWAGDISIGSSAPILLSASQLQPDQAPYYDRASSILGGGSIGLAPFELHAADCDPPSGSFTGIWGGNEVVALRHYGPVEWEPYTFPVTVEWYDGADWWDITEDFLVVSAGGSDREILVVALTDLDFQEDIVYRIRPVVASPGPTQSILRCSGVNGTPPVAWYEYRLNW